MVIWVQTKRVRVTRPLTKTALRQDYCRLRWTARADPAPRPRPAVYVAYFALVYLTPQLTLLAAIIVKIKALAH
jgi:hypothetical protein